MTQPRTARAADLAARLAAVGPYFEILTGTGGPAGLRPLRELYATGPDSVLAARIPAVAERLGTAELRVAASILQLGLASRLWSVALGAAALGGTTVDLHPDRVEALLPPQGPLVLRLRQQAGHPEPDRGHPADRPEPEAGARTPEPPSAARLYRAVVTDNLVPLAAAVRAVAPVSEGLLRGNAASALAGSLRVLYGWAAARRPEAARTARRLADDLLALDALTGTGTLTCAGPAAMPAFRRTSCCLYYRIGPRAGICGDCVFDAPPGRP
ncbi:(2Fe-2S)-binding protein [Kitasatospora sp. NBC_00240]|uniref:(2Fe-2S)-binding protein n=1 Tax=Kitasatospora sp. NBC_00240 TaxID=2903567 RepID=UPI00224CF999|nr:(2Fe-2S)-binding protein [Kitasatospora sp. NBC_00240]MCX5214120.1 (2Fe-2S)-binding protein [Kitasatospora sp. NBC_00240]